MQKVSERRGGYLPWSVNASFACAAMFAEVISARASREIPLVLICTLAGSLQETTWQQTQLRGVLCSFGHESGELS